MKIELIQAISHASEGQTVGWFGSRWDDVSEDFNATDTICKDSASMIRRANGMQEIRFPSGGRIRFITPTRGRGLSLDRAYMPRDMAEQDVANILPALQTSPAGAACWY